MSEGPNPEPNRGPGAAEPEGAGGVDQRDDRFGASCVPVIGTRTRPGRCSTKSWRKQRASDRWPDEPSSNYPRSPAASRAWLRSAKTCHWKTFRYAA